MVHCEVADVGTAGFAPHGASVETLFELGMMYAAGRTVPLDYVVAHKWLNIAAMRGHAEATRLRREIAAEMSDAEIGQAQRAARDWLKAESREGEQRTELRAAA